MNCEEISELLPAYVLGALEAGEMEAIEAHLRVGHEHDAELVELRAIVFAMDRYQDEIVPRPSVPLAAVPSGLVVPAPVADTPRPKRPTPWFRTPMFVRAAAAALLLLVFGAGWVVGSALMGDGGEVLAYILENEDGAYMEVRGATDAASVTVIMDGLQQLSGNSYQVWAIREERWVSIGVCNTDEDGWWKGDFDFGLQEGEEVALTIERQGGSDRPTSEPVLSSSH